MLIKFKHKTKESRYQEDSQGEDEKNILLNEEQKFNYQLDMTESIKINENSNSETENDNQFHSLSLNTLTKRKKPYKNHEESDFSINSELINHMIEPTDGRFQRKSRPRGLQPLHPCFINDHRRKCISEINIPPNVKTQYQNIFDPMNQTDLDRKQELIDKIEKTFSMQSQSYQYNFNEKLTIIEENLDKLIQELELIKGIPIFPDKLLIQRKYCQLDNFIIPSELRQKITSIISRFKPLMDLFNHQTKKIVLSFLERLGERKLPLNLKITIDTIGECQDQPLKRILIPKKEFWIIKLILKQEQQFYIINPLKLNEASTLLALKEPLLIEMINLHQRDPRKFRSLFNLDATEIELNLQSIFPSDLGWIFNYKDKHIKRFKDITSFMIIDQGETTIIEYFKAYYFTVIIFSQIPIFQVANTFAMNGSQIKIKMIKTIKKSQLNTPLDIGNYFKEITILNVPKQQLEGLINHNQKILFDLRTRKFHIEGQQLPLLNNDIIIIKQINIL
ncbi:hypothetical protein ABPG72_020023 [Tetrahymena utriculariae]